MKILLCNHRYFLSGGPERYMFRVKAILESKGHEVIPFSYDYALNRENEYSRYFAEPPFGKDAVYFADAKMNIFDKFKYYRKMIYNFDARKKVKHLLGKEKIDLCYTIQLANCLYPSIIDGCREMGVPVVARFSDFQLFCPAFVFYMGGRICEECNQGLHRAVVNKCIKNSYLLSCAKVSAMYVHRFLKATKKINAFIAPSLFLKTKMIEYGLEQSKVFNIPSFLNTGNYKEHYAHEGYILYVGMILKYKGVGHLIKAFEKIHDKDLSLKIAGSSSDGEKERLENYVLKRNINNVHFLGHRIGEELTELYQKAMFVVCPSTWYENMPNVIIESMAYGKPVLGSNVGSIPELIDDGVDGMLFNPGDPDDLAEKIKYLLGNPNKIHEMGKNAREKAEKKYNEEIHYQKLMRIFEGVLHG